MHTSVAIRNKRSTWQFWCHPSGRAWRGSCVTPTPSGTVRSHEPALSAGAVLHQRPRLGSRRERIRADEMSSWRDASRAPNRSRNL